MSKQPFHVEARFADFANQGALRTLATGHGRQGNLVHVFGPARQPAVRTRVSIVLYEELDAQRLLGRVAVVGQDAGAQHVKAVPAPGLDDVLRQVVERLGEGVGVRVVEYRQNLAAPVPHGRQQGLELGLDADMKNWIIWKEVKEDGTGT